MSDYFFYDMNKKMADLAKKQQLAEEAQATPAKPAPNKLMEAAADYSAKKASAGKDIGKPGKNFSKIAAGAAKRYGSAEAGKRVAGAVLNKLRHPTEESIDQAQLKPWKATMKEGGKPDFLDLDKDGNRKEPMKSAARDAKKGLREVDATPQHVDDWTPPAKPAPKASTPKPPVPVKPAPKKPAMYPPQAIDDPVKEGGVPMTPKQQKFAKLAPPVDKITFADKIVGAKKEVDEMLGDVAANAMKKAVGKMGRNRDMEESWIDDEPTRRRSSSGGEIDTSQPGRTIHRAVKGAYSGASHDASADEPSGSVGRRKVGAGMGKKIGAKINRGTSKLMTKEGDMPEDMIEPQDQGEYDQEGEMAKDSIKTVVRHAQALEQILGDNDNLPEWVQSKLAKIESMMSAVDDYMQNQEDDGDEMEMDEESTSKRDNRAEKAGKKVAKDIEYDEKKKDGIHGKRRGSEDDKAEKAGKKVTKDIEYDEKKDKKKKEVDETTSSGSVATSGAAPKASGGTNFGKGIYDSLNRQLENMISESMNINMSMNNDEHGGPKKSLTVTATDDDAVMLAGLLKMAGMGHGDDHIHAMTGDDSDMHAIHAMDDEPCADCGASPCGCDDEMMDETHGHGHGDVCPSCGASPCCCDTIEEAYGDTAATENEPDWPTDEEGTEDAMMYRGGLNGPKSTGQTTIPVIAGQDDRMGYNGLDEELSRMMKIAGLR